MFPKELHVYLVHLQFELGLWRLAVYSVYPLPCVEQYESLIHQIHVVTPTVHYSYVRNTMIQPQSVLVTSELNWI